MAEIIDLTGEDSDVALNEVRHTHTFYSGSEMHGLEANEPNHAKGNSTPALSRQQPLQKHKRQPRKTAALRSLAPAPAQTSQHRIPSQGQTSRAVCDIVKPIDWSKAKTARKWEYDPKTLVNDVLLATNSHPDRQGLNHHLLPLANHFPHLNEDSDISTIRWDLVGGLGVLGRAVNNETTAMSPNHSTQNLAVRSPMEPSKGGVSGGLYGTTSKRYSGVPLNYYHQPDDGYAKRTLDSTQQLDAGLGNSIQQLDSRQQSHGWGSPHQQADSRPQIQQSMVSSGFVPPRPTSSHTNGQSATTYGSPYSHAPSFGMDGSYMSSLSRGQGPAHTSNSTRENSSFSVVVNPSKTVNFIGPTAIPGSLASGFNDSRSGSDAPNPASYILGPGRTPKNFAIEIPNLTPKKKGRSLKDSRATPPTDPIVKKRGRPFKDYREPPATDPISKKRGRPFKTPESAARAAARSDSVDEIPKKRGRPFMIRGHVDIPVPEPVYIPFICEWKGCPAELQNLETLEAHVFNVHSKKQPLGSRLCLWGACGANPDSMDDESHAYTHKPKGFRTKKEWKSHINEKHLIPFAWMMGDGPRGTSLSLKPAFDLDSDPWLYDSKGRRVTPSVKNQPVEGGRAKDNNKRRFIKRFDGIHYVWERIQSPEAYKKVQHLPPNEDSSDGDDEGDTPMGYMQIQPHRSKHNTNDGDEDEDTPMGESP